MQDNVTNLSNRSAIKFEMLDQLGFYKAPSYILSQGDPVVANQPKTSQQQNLSGVAVI
jgi:ectoine hydroxylase-related dioxygenase (phytanoyl-CoA dioxygenase family)